MLCLSLASYRIEWRSWRPPSLRTWVAVHSSHCAIIVSMCCPTSSKHVKHYQELCLCCQRSVAVSLFHSCTQRFIRTGTEGLSGRTFLSAFTPVAKMSARVHVTIRVWVTLVPLATYCNQEKYKKTHKQKGVTETPRVVSTTLTRILLKLASYQPKKHFAE